MLFYSYDESKILIGCKSRTSESKI